jgi:hypothetical protein
MNQFTVPNANRKQTITTLCTTQTSNGRWRVSAQCLKCETNISQYIQKPQENKLLLAK